MAKKSKSWRFIAGGAIEPLIHKEMWVETFLDCLNKKKRPRNYLVVRKNTWSSEYISEKDLPELFNASKQFIKPNNFRIFLRSSDRSRAVFQRAVKKFKRLSGRKFTKKELTLWFKKYLELFRSITIHFWATQSEFFQYPEKIFREAIQKVAKSSAELEEAIAILISPTKLNIIEEEEIDLVNLAGKNSSRDKLIAHASKYPWLFFNTFDKEEALSFLQKRIKKSDYKIFDREDLLKNKKILHREQKVMLKKLNSRKIDYLSFFFREIAIERFKLKACWAGATFLFLPLFEKIAKELETDVNNLLWFWRAEEIRSGLENNIMVAEAEVNKRKAGYVIWLNKDRINFFSGRAVLKVIEKRLSAEIHARSKFKKLEGITASLGKAEGRARIVHIEDLKKLNRDWKSFKKGEIMIVTMTQPNMMPIIRKATAVVTDEGGITSHAAIICRELKIPCVVGTRNATHLFQTGDKVSVDAEKGTVSLIK